MITIDVRKQDISKQHLAKRTWQAMFNLYKDAGGDLGNLYDLLCDYKVLEDCYGVYKNIHTGILWGFDLDGFTALGDSALHTTFEHLYTIQYSDNKITLTEQTQ